jgi:trimethylamine--corrinoid protein Co-methyltransferase
MAPKGLVIYDLKGRPAMDLSAANSYFGTSTASPKIRDALTGELHETRLSDIAMASRVAEKLEHIDFVMPFGSAQDCPGPLADAHEFLALSANTVKPVVFCGYSALGVATVLDLAEVLAGGSDELRRRPSVIPYPEPISPLTWPDDIVDKIIVCAKRGAPHLTTSAQIRSMSAPVTAAGAIALSTAESLFSNVMTQLTRQGSPVFLAAIIATVNPRNGLAAMAGPEYCLAMCAQAEIGRRLGLPTWGTGGMTESKIIDAQAGADSAFTLLSQALGGLSLIHDCGYLDTGLAGSAAMMVLDDEIIAQVKFFMRGLEVSPETLALDVIDEVGPGGGFMAKKHTVRHLRSENWFPSLFCRVGREAWLAEGGKTTEEMADEKVKRILEGPGLAPLDPAMEAEMRRIVAKAESGLA